MPKKPPTPAERANQITFLLKGNLKNARIAYIRVAVMLAEVRDEALWKALHYPSLADYAEKQLRLAEPTLYKYLRVHDWLKKSHPSWLVSRPKGFIPELSDVVSLEWIEERLEDANLEPGLRKELEDARKRALVGTLSYRDFVALRSRAQKKLTTLRSILARTRALAKAALRVPNLPPAALDGYDAAIRALEAATAATDSVARLRGLRTTVLTALGRRVGSSTDA
jgi:hypothetical protein